MSVMGFSECNQIAFKFNYYHFFAILVCSMPLPGKVNVVFRFYLDWIVQLLFALAAAVMLWTLSFFFGGMCIFIGGMVDDLGQTIIELEGVKKTTANIFSTEIAFHNDIIE